MHKHQNLRNLIFKSGAQRIRNRGGVADWRRLRLQLSEEAQYNDLGVKLNWLEALNLAQSVTESLRASFKFDSHRAKPARSQLERGRLSDSIAEAHKASIDAGSPKSIRTLAAEFGVSKSQVQRILSSRFNVRSRNARYRTPLELVLEAALPREGRLMATSEALERRLEIEYGPGSHLQHALELLDKSNSAIRCDPFEGADGSQLYVISRGRRFSYNELQIWAARTEERRLAQNDPSRPSQLRYLPYQDFVSSASPEPIIKLLCSIVAVANDYEDINSWLTFFEFIDMASYAQTSYNPSELKNKIAGAFRLTALHGFEAITAVISKSRHRPTKKLVRENIDYVLFLQNICKFGEYHEKMLDWIDNRTGIKDALSDRELETFRLVTRMLANAGVNRGDDITPLMHSEAHDNLRKMRFDH